MKIETKLTPKDKDTYFVWEMKPNKFYIIVHVSGAYLLMPLPYDVSYFDNPFDAYQWLINNTVGCGWDIQ